MGGTETATALAGWPNGSEHGTSRCTLGRAAGGDLAFAVSLPATLPWWALCPVGRVLAMETRAASTENREVCMVSCQGVGVGAQRG